MIHLLLTQRWFWNNQLSIFSIPLILKAHHVLCITWLIDLGINVKHPLLSYSGRNLTQLLFAIWPSCKGSTIPTVQKSQALLIHLRDILCNFNSAITQIKFNCVLYQHSVRPCVKGSLCMCHVMSHSWNSRPQFIYSPYNYRGVAMTVKGTHGLWMRITNVKCFWLKIFAAKMVIKRSSLGNSGDTKGHIRVRDYIFWHILYKYPRRDLSCSDGLNPTSKMNNKKSTKWTTMCKIANIGRQNPQREQPNCARG